MSHFQNSVLLLLLVFLLNSCQKRFSCDESDHKKLGAIEFSPIFQEYTIEDQSNSMVFNDGESDLVFNRNNQIETTPYRLQEYNICESIDVKPFTAFAYYEYKNRSSAFVSNELLIEINPQIEKQNGNNAEFIYLSIAQNETFKASIPIGDQTEAPPFGNTNVRFEWKEQIELNGKVFYQVWHGQSANQRMGLFYKKEQGIIAIEIEGRYYLRVE
ncbi:MAG: hypothetical protein AAF985_12210 [Bacteroidota bacterium]